MENVSVIKAKDAGAGAWIFAALHGSAPRLIFPRRYIDSKSLEISIKKVSFVFEFEPQKNKIDVEFGNTIDAITFYSFVSLP